MQPFKYLLTAVLIFSVTFTIAQGNLQPDTLKQNTPTFTAVEKDASYIGGIEAWQIFLQKNLNSKIANKNNAPVGKYTAIVRFIVNKEGLISDIKPETNFGFGMEDEVVRVLELSGKWVPATRNGIPLNAYRRQPITFLLTTTDFEITTAEPYTLFANVDNEISVTAKKLKPADISINVQGGKSTQIADGKFIVRVSKTGRVIIEIVNNKKEDKEIGLASFEVKVK
jgi:hypothetical protein